MITNAFYFAVRHIGYALAVAVITVLPMTMTLVDAKLFPVYLLIWLMFGFSLTAYADSWFMWKLFKPYFKEEEEGHHYVDTEPDQYAFKKIDTTSIKNRKNKEMRGTEYGMDQIS